MYGCPVGKAPATAEFHLVESASAIHYGLEVEDEDDEETRSGDCLLIRLGTNEAGTTEDLPLPADAPARPGAASACSSGRGDGSRGCDSERAPSLAGFGNADGNALGLLAD